MCRSADRDVIVMWTSEEYACVSLLVWKELSGDCFGRFIVFLYVSSLCMCLVNLKNNLTNYTLSCWLSGFTGRDSDKARLLALSTGESLVAEIFQDLRCVS